ncbi:hypothetical protein FALBO_5211 [Fusarium albosuccineum]|uniref:CENP-V/GFA domain-containing protein n=1 Tax=Fusarium albosuccineum TaxID=1237068 RepID=A0A8H4LH11_9HYPO|nr:hypothetical protein FALBO_5211 [Fusarium albosuccineum]
MHLVSCLCGSVTQKVSSQAPGTSGSIELALCHCDTCRHSTGLLCTSYLPIQEPDSTNNLTVFKASDRSSRYFCSVCGCHVFRSLKKYAGELIWGVATGTISSSDELSESVIYGTHTQVADTVDGGLSKWISLDKQKIPLDNSSSKVMLPAETASLEATCACGGLSLRITRPNETSRLPQRGYSDLTHPYCSTDDSVRSNPSDEKWWVRGNKYFAGTCACWSCRLISGFEIQTWAFVPAANIFLRTPGEAKAEIPLDFEGLPVNVLQSYRSSPGVFRDFCGKCGATVFWRDSSDPSVVDVSVGLLRSEDGARAESWLEWCTERVSFSEEVQTGRSGPLATASQDLMDTLALGLKADTGS